MNAYATQSTNRANRANHNLHAIPLHPQLAGYAVYQRIGYKAHRVGIMHFVRLYMYE
jgi:hypothetical protein